jgi:DNA-binding winged helix-turn-helix (wHTH) protein
MGITTESTLRSIRPDSVRPEPDTTFSAARLSSTRVPRIVAGTFCARVPFANVGRDEDKPATDPRRFAKRIRKGMRTEKDAERALLLAQPRVSIASEDAALRSILAHRTAMKGLVPVVAVEIQSARSYLESNATVALLLYTSDGIGLTCRCVALHLCLRGQNITILRVDEHVERGWSSTALAAPGLSGAIDNLLDAVAEGTLRSKASATHTTASDAAAAPVQRVLRYASIVLDVAKDTVAVDDCGVHLAPIPFRILKYLLFNVGRVVPENELMGNALQTHHSGGSSSLREHVRLLRQRLGKAGQDIKTIRGAGYGIGVSEESPGSHRRRSVSKN